MKSDCGFSLFMNKGFSCIILLSCLVLNPPAYGKDAVAKILSSDAEVRKAEAVAASAIPPSNATTDILRLAGEYSYGNGFDVNCTLEIGPDGRFLFKKCNCDEVVDRAVGTAAIVNGVVQLTPEKPRDSWPKGTAAELVPVAWGQRLYLVPTDDFHGFSNHVNQGREPVSRGSMGGYYLREGDWDRPVAGKPELPADWKTRVLDEPIHGQVAGKDPSNRWIINLGQKHGVYDRMELSAWTPDLQKFVTLIVTETGTDSSAIQIVNAPADLPILGWIVYSKIVPPKKN